MLVRRPVLALVAACMLLALPTARGVVFVPGDGRDGYRSTTTRRSTLLSGVHSLTAGTCFLVGAGATSDAASSSSSSSSSISPEVWLGTCCETGDATRNAVLAGLELGYRRVDTASHYGNEADVRYAIDEAVARGFVRTASDVAVCTKIWFDDLGYDATVASVLASKDALGDSLDAALVHFPGTIDAVQSPAANRRKRAETWAALEALKADGVVGRIGLSNYAPRHVREHAKAGRAVPDLVQLESHVFNANSELVDLWRDVAGGAASPAPTFQAYSPLASGRLDVKGDATLAAVAAAASKRLGADVAPAQVALAWLVARGLQPVCKATTPAHLRDNLIAITDLRLTDDDLATISRLDRGASVAFDASLIA